jgi:MYXO-CTERM domain-containing protein
MFGPESDSSLVSPFPHFIQEPPFMRLAAVLPIVAFASAAVSSTALAGVFTAGNLLVSRYGDGTATLTSAAAAVAINEYTTAAGQSSAVQSIAFATSGANQFTDSGTATSDGYLNTYNGYVAIAGYNAATGTASVASSNTKVVQVLDSTGSVVNRAVFPTGGSAGSPPSPFSGNNIRSAIATSATNFYATGTSSGSPNTGGAWYSNSTNYTQVSSTASGQPTNMRMVGIFGGQLYASSGASTGNGVWAVGSGLTTSSGQTSTLVINAGSGASIYGFVMFDTNQDGSVDLAYLADDRSAAGGGLQKWMLVGGTWTQSWSRLVNSIGTLSDTAGTGFAGIRGLTGTWDAVNGAQLYATTTEANNNRLISIVDNGSTPTLATNLASAGTNYVFRGVAFTPGAIPAPGALALLGVAGLVGSRRRR